MAGSLHTYSKPSLFLFYLLVSWHFWADDQMSTARVTLTVLWGRMRLESLRQSDRIQSELTAADGCGCIRLQFRQEEQQRYQWLTTAVSASAWEWRLTDGEHDIDVSTMQPDESSEDIWYVTTHVQSAQSPWHDTQTRSYLKKMQKTLVIIFSKLWNVLLSHLTDKKCKYMTLDWLRERAEEGECDNTFPYALIISSLWFSFCFNS